MEASGDAGESIRLWNVASGTFVRMLSSNTSVLSIDFSPDSRWMAAGLADDSIAVFEVDGGVVVQMLR
jgi:WD40 repeat protein